MNVDHKITCYIHDKAGKLRSLDRAAVFVARDFPFIVIGVPLVYVLVAVGFAPAVLMSVIILFSILVQLAAQKIARRKRPYQAEHLKPLFKLRIGTRSFPSGHGTLMGSLIFSVLIADTFLNPYVLTFVLIGAFLILLSRVYAGLHYISDIVAGLILGFASGALLYAVISFFSG